MLGSHKDIDAPKFTKEDSSALFNNAVANGGLTAKAVLELLSQFDNDDDREALVAFYGGLHLNHDE